MTSENWICKNCSEKIELQFDACWNCGYSKNKETVETIENIDDYQNPEIEDRSDKKYGLLKVYQGIMLLGIGACILSIPIVGFFWITDSGINSDDFAVWIIIASLYIFAIYCQFLIIDFLFYLNKKINNLR